MNDYQIKRKLLVPVIAFGFIFVLSFICSFWIKEFFIFILESLISLTLGLIITKLTFNYFNFRINSANRPTIRNQYIPDTYSQIFLLLLSGISFVSYFILSEISEYQNFLLSIKISLEENQLLSSIQYLAQLVFIMQVIIIIYFAWKSYASPIQSKLNYNSFGNNQGWKGSSPTRSFHSRKYNPKKYRSK